ncbi:hypothetical protein [Variovorax saccharolyticus]|uniref:hypothetical protein n=1 Tax=Variovorax saccharolyticus TaxID=3053516 RepID=UPI002576DB62|nr:hypothetical protein [Variovorax sp. J31P216]MDM0030054.1 hypothetical protein [Variovorax sp. J31P216]
MPEVKMSVSLKVAGGPALAVNFAEDVEAYDVIEVTVPPNTPAFVVQLQPAAAARVNLMLIQSDRYGAEITYKASDGAADSDAVTLHGPQLFGRGTLSLFGLNVLSLKFGNAHPAPVGDAPALAARIQIVVGRDATL